MTADLAPDGRVAWAGPRQFYLVIRESQLESGGGMALSKFYESAHEAVLAAQVAANLDGKARAVVSLREVAYVAPHHFRPRPTED